jgi:hypothetical protein
MSHTKNILCAAALMLATFAVSSCKKDHPHTTPDAATITINSPAAGSNYSPNDTVKIKATITAEESLHGGDIFIRNLADTSTAVFTTDFHTHGTDITIDTFWVNTLSGIAVNLELEITAIIDHDGNTQSKKVAFVALP